MRSFLSKLVRKNFFSCLTFFLFVVITFVGNNEFVAAAVQSNLKNSDSTVIEYLKLSVPAQNRKAWLLAEEKSWGPWLKEQKGFIQRQLLWDPEMEEALLLISWASRKDWKNISQVEIDSVQELFEKIAIEATGQKFGNPFPIQSQGELVPQ